MCQEYVKTLLDGHIDQPLTPSHVKNTQAGATPVNGESKPNSVSLQDSIRIESWSTFEGNPAEHLPPQNTKPVPGHYQENSRHELEDIPELEEEDWEEGQFADADLIDCHNTTHKSDRLRQE